MRKLIALVALCGAATACDIRLDDGFTGPGLSVLGTFVLRSVNGTALPVTLSPALATSTRQLVADTLTFVSAGTVREIRYTVSTTGSSAPVVSTVALTGPFTMVRDSITLSTDFPYLYGRYASDTVSLVATDGLVYRYTRR